MLLKWTCWDHNSLYLFFFSFCAFSGEVTNFSLLHRFSYHDNPGGLQVPWSEAITVSFISVMGCLCLHCLPRDRVLFWYDFCKYMCCQVFVSKEVGEGESTPCTTSRGSEVVLVSALPRNSLQAELIQAFAAAHAKSRVALPGWCCRSWDAPAVGREGEESRAGKKGQGRPQRAGRSPPVTARRAGSNCCLFWPQPPAATWASRGPGTGRAGSMATVTLLPWAMALFAFLPSTLPPAFAWPPSKRRPTTSSTSRVVALPSPRWDVGLQGHEPQIQPFRASRLFHGIWGIQTLESLGSR